MTEKLRPARRNHGQTEDINTRIPSVIGHLTPGKAVPYPN
jgi:hypothetical protein